MTSRNRDHYTECDDCGNDVSLADVVETTPQFGQQYLCPSCADEPSRAGEPRTGPPPATLPSHSALVRQTMKD